jgi:hypothetical protein
LLCYARTIWLASPLPVQTGFVRQQYCACDLSVTVFAIRMRRKKKAIIELENGGWQAGGREPGFVGFPDSHI